MSCPKAKTKETKTRYLTGRYWEVLGGRRCVEPRISLLFLFRSFWNEWRFCFFLYFYRVFLLGSLTSSSGKYIHISRALDRISISIRISHAATVLLLPTSFSSSSSSSSSSTTYHYHLASIST